MDKLVLATKNEGKRIEMEAALAPLGVEVISLASLGSIAEPVEDATTFAGNAQKKARFYAQRTKLPCIADDSGIEVEALGGAPGVYSARYAGHHGDDAANNAKLCAELRARGLRESPADYRCAMVFADPEGTEHLTEGRSDGKVVLTPRGTGGFGYDPYFIPEEYPDRHMAELTLEEKQAISHRGRALSQMLEWLEAYYGSRNRK